MIKQYTAPALLALALLLCHCQQQGPASVFDDNTVVVTEYYGPYNVEKKYYGKPAGSLVSRAPAPYVALDRAAGYDTLNIGVLIPNNPKNDAYWQAVWNGVNKASDRLGLRQHVKITESYGNPGQHMMQFDSLAQDPEIDAIVIGAIDYRLMDEQIAQATQGTAYGRQLPVIAFVNDLYAPAVTAKVLVSFYDMGRQAGQFVNDHAYYNSKETVTVGLFPGPRTAGWAPETVLGFVEAMRESEAAVTILEPAWGVPVPADQDSLVIDLLKANPKVDYLVGNAVAAHQAVNTVQSMGTAATVFITSTYFTPDIEPDIASGAVLAAPSDQPDKIGEIAIDLAVRYIYQQAGDTLPFRISPDITLETALD